MVVLAKARRKPSREVMLASWRGSVFNVLIALGKKEYCMVIVQEPDVMSSTDGGISTRLFTILNSKISYELNLF